MTPLFLICSICLLIALVITFIVGSITATTPPQKQIVMKDALALWFLALMFAVLAMLFDPNLGKLLEVLLPSFFQEINFDLLG